MPTEKTTDGSTASDAVSSEFVEIIDREYVALAGVHARAREGSTVTADVFPTASTSSASVQAPTDLINHPPHYKQGGIETITVIESWRLGFCLGNVVKYIARAEHKGQKLQDLKKARWYLNREIERLEPSPGS